MGKHLKQRGDGIAEKRPSSPVRTDKTIMVKFSGELAQELATPRLAILC